jgi:hypothetical protein
MMASRMPNPDSSKSCMACIICTNSRGVALKVFHVGRGTARQKLNWRAMPALLPANYSSRVRQSVPGGNNG